MGEKTGTASSSKPKRPSVRRAHLSYSWLGTFIASVIFADFFLFGSAAYEFNEFWPDIVGTFIGVLGALSAGETLQSYRSARRFNERIDGVAEEVMSLAGEFASLSYFPIANPRCKALLFSEDGRYLSSGELGQLGLLDQIVDYRDGWLRRLDDEIARTEVQSTRLYDILNYYDEQGFQICDVIIDDYYPTAERNARLDKLSRVLKTQLVESYKRRKSENR